MRDEVESNRGSGGDGGVDVDGDPGQRRRAYATGLNRD
jgi:hypothetical protein